MIGPTIRVDTRDFQRGIRELAAAKRTTVKTVLRQQARLFVRDVINMTPPFGKNPVNAGAEVRAAGPLDHRDIGREAVERDINRVFSTVEQLDVVKNAQTRLGPALKKAAAARNVPAVTAILKNIGLHPEVVLQAASDIHKRHRGSRGRVQRQKPAAIVLEPGSIKRYIAQVQRRVGYAKSGWMAAAAKLHVTVRGWIKVHHAPGSVIDQLDHPDRPSITVANNVSFAADFQQLRIIDIALKIRANKMRDNIAILLAANLKKVRSRVGAGGR